MFLHCTYKTHFKKDSLVEHKYAILTENSCYPVAVHYKAAGHKNSNSLKIIATEGIFKSVRGGDKFKQRETRST